MDVDAAQSKRSGDDILKKLYFGGIIPFKIPLRGQIFEAVSRESRGRCVGGGAFAAVDRHLHSN